MDSFPPLMGSCGAILGIIEQSTRSQNAAHFNKNGAVWSHFVSHSLVHTILFLYLLQPPGGCKGMYLLDCKSINHSNHDKEIGAPPPHRPKP